ncbi:MAG: aldo/keto reductase [Lachnospiraceae bacterium]|nr:aldo/keto reductase [Lachnospiraceae bacterium]
MQYRRLGQTEVMVSEIGLGAEWLERMDVEGCRAIINACEKEGINILDCWMSEPNVRTAIGECIRDTREKWYIQGHIGSTWQNGQYVRTREIPKVKAAFEDLLARLGTDYIDLGMIHYVDSEKEWEEIIKGPFMEYVHELKEKGVIKHIGLSSHNPKVAKMAVLSGEIEMMLFSVNPAFDLMPPTENIDDYFTEQYDMALAGMDPERAALYSLCEQCDVGITVMKGFAGGRLFQEKTSPFGVALTPVQCIHYALTRPGVASVMAGFSEVKHVAEAVAYETASDEEKDYASILASAPRHAYSKKCMYCNHCKPCPAGIDIAMVNKLYDLATMQDTVPSSVMEHYRALEKNASDCIACGGCETRCPFGVEIVEKMGKTKELFREDNFQTAY